MGDLSDAELRERFRASPHSEEMMRIFLRLSLAQREYLVKRTEQLVEEGGSQADVLAEARKLIPPN